VRVGVVDIGTNSTRLLVADVDGGQVREVERHSRVTRLGQGLEAGGELGEEPRRRVLATLDEYHAAIERHGCDATTGVLTSAVRDAANGADFADEIQHRHSFGARTIDGETEARLTFLGATAGSRTAASHSTLVIDIGGGSTEQVVGRDGEVSFHASAPAGVVRQTERHLHDDPPAPEQLQSLVADVRATIADAVPAQVRDSAALGIAVAGTATSAAAIDLELEPYDPSRVEGHVLELGELELLLSRLAAVPLDTRRRVAGLHPDRAPTIVAGVAILIEALRLFGLREVTVSEHDILWGAALARAGADPEAD
jgi:exopolyphosphatase / guanosine-5'-triphosphate,3'-diphosphate pyrophosphatase